MKKQSAGILLYRIRRKELEVFLVHPGGPFWKNKNKGAWSIPKGEFEPDEQPLDAAKREFTEETGINLSGNFVELVPIKQKSWKQVLAWVIEGDADASKFSSNHFEMEWPPKSGKMSSFPEIDKAEWMNMSKAKQLINPAQAGLLDQLQELVKKNV